MSDYSKEFQEIIKNMELLANKIDSIEKRQKQIDEKVNRIQSSISGIENDIYEDDFEVEIICPYCNTEFVADVESKTEIKCPECQNKIELDWNGGEDQGCCSGHCSSCSSRCGETFFDEFGEDINFIEENEEDNHDNM